MVDGGQDEELAHDELEVVAPHAKPVCRVSFGDSGDDDREIIRSSDAAATADADAAAAAYIMHFTTASARSSGCSESLT